ncbi:MAG: DUF3662 and FHA domain-containing protein [Raoultibacter sp.]
MGFFSRFEGRVEDTFEGAADKMFDSPISPVQIAKKAEKQMRREKMVGAGKQYAPTLYTVLVNPEDDQRLFGYYPTLAGETETYLVGKAGEQGFVMDGQPLVRFIVDEGLKHGKFDIIAEMVSGPIVAQLRAEEMQRYGLGDAPPQQPQGYAQPQNYAAGTPNYAVPVFNNDPYAAPVQDYAAPRGYDQPHGSPFEEFPDFNADANQAFPDKKPGLPYVPEDELDYSIDYGEYTFDSQNFDDSRHGFADDGRGVLPPQSVNAGFVDNAANGFSDFIDPAQAAAFAAPAPDAAFAPTPHPIPRHAPNTTVFAAGAAGVNPIPRQQAVRARLIDIGSNRSYDLAAARLILGRESTNDIVINDLNASRTHAELRFEPQGVWVITDLGSTNGTKVNGRIITSQPLYEGDQITIGVTNLVFTQA